MEGKRDGWNDATNEGMVEGVELGKKEDTNVGNPGGRVAGSPVGAGEGLYGNS